MSIGGMIRQYKEQVQGGDPQALYSQEVEKAKKELLPQIGSMSRSDFDKALEARLAAMPEHVKAAGERTSGGAINLGDDFRIFFGRKYDEERKKHLIGERESALEGYKAQEDKLLGDLGTQASSTQSALDSQLARLLEDTGISANLTRGQVGAVMAERGLGRSSFAQQGIEDVTAGEIQKKGQLRGQFMQEKQQVSDITRRTKEAVQENRKRAALAESMEEISDLDRRQFADKQQTMQIEFEAEMARSARRASSSAFNQQLTAGVFQSAAMLAVGGL